MIVYPFSKLYRQYVGINSGDYQKIISFFEENEEEIRALPWQQFREITESYADAVFETGGYNNYIWIVEEILPWAFEYESSQEDIHKLLFRKAASLYNLGHLKKSEIILEQLYRMNPNNSDARFFLKKCFKAQNFSKIQMVRAISLFLIFLSAFVILIELLWISPFFEKAIYPVRILRSSLFTVAFIIIVGNLIFQEMMAQLFLYSKRKTP